MSNDIPKNWMFVKIGEICDINPDDDFSNLDPMSPVSFIPMSAIDEIMGTVKESQIIPLNDIRKGHTHFKENDILFSRITPCMENGKSAIARNLKNGLGFGSTEFIVIRTSIIILPEMIFYFIRQESYRNKAKMSFRSTVGQLRVPKEFVALSDFPLPPLAEQHRIVAKVEEIFTKLDAGIEALKKAKEQIKRYRQAVLKYAFEGKLTEEWRKSFELLMLNGELKETQNSTLSTQNSTLTTQNSKLPRGWVWVRLGEICERISNGLTKRQNKDPKGFIVTRIETISEGYINLKKVGYLDEVTDEEIKKYKLLRGDILFSHINSDLHLGKSAVFQDDSIELLHGMNLLLIRPIKDFVHSKFLNYLFNNYRNLGLFISIAQHAVNQSSINQTKLKNLGSSPKKLQK